MAEAAPPSNYSMPAQEKLTAAQRYKRTGNEAFRAKQFRAALRSYHKALLYLRGVDQHAVKMPNMLATAQQQREREERELEMTDELSAAVEELKVDVYNNLCACLLQDRERFTLEKVLEYCDQVETMQPSNCKSWFRRGQAYVKAGDYEKAEHSLKKAKSFMTEPDPALDRLLATCRAELKQQYEKQKSLYRGMFAAPVSPQATVNGANSSAESAEGGATAAENGTASPTECADAARGSAGDSASPSGSCTDNGIASNTEKRDGANGSSDSTVGVDGHAKTPVAAGASVNGAHVA